MKIVRDNIPKIANDPERFIQVDEQTAKTFLFNKIYEELKEASEAQTEKELIEELGDVLEVIESFIRTISPDAIVKVNEAKHKKWVERGGFDERWVMLSAPK